MCQPAAALIFTNKGEVEVFSGSQKCSMPVTTFPKFSGLGKTSSLLDEELLLLGDDDLGIKGGRYISIKKPRDGLLAMKYSIQDIPLIGSPHRHTSLVSRNELFVLGGKFKSKGKLSEFTWTELALHWENGTKFNPDFEASCTVKIAADVHIIFGGENNNNHERKSGRTVVKINTTEQTAYKMKPSTHARMNHDCEMLTSSIVLLSGGEDQSNVQPDELYNITSEEVVQVLGEEQSLGRTQHVLFRRAEQLFALGGRNSNNEPTSNIKIYNASTVSWDDFSQGLLSSETSDLAITPYPMSALDCAGECQCGVAHRNQRIFGGTTTEVTNQ